MKGLHVLDLDHFEEFPFKRLEYGLSLKKALPYIYRVIEGVNVRTDSHHFIIRHKNLSRSYTQRVPRAPHLIIAISLKHRKLQREPLCSL